MPNLQAAGHYKSSFCSTILEDDKSKANGEFEFDLKWTANSMYSASVDTVRCLYLPWHASGLKGLLLDYDNSLPFHHGDAQLP